MSNVIDNFPPEHREIFVEVLDRKDPELLSTLRGQDVPTPEQKETVDDIFSAQIVRELGPGPDHAPSERGQRIKRAIEEFWFVWPSNGDR